MDCHEICQSYSRPLEVVHFNDSGDPVTFPRVPLSGQNLNLLHLNTQILSKTKTGEHGVCFQNFALQCSFAVLRRRRRIIAFISVAVDTSVLSEVGKKLNNSVAVEAS